MSGTDRKLYFLAFTARGLRLAEELASAVGGEAAQSGHAGGNETAQSRYAGSARQWTERHFAEADGLIYVGAAGIAVRSIAPYIRSKTTDPAVIVIDEGGSFIIPVLSGHLGGANDLARELAVLTGGQAVITTATDVNGRFAVDEWAKRQQCVVKDPEKIVRISSKILSGEEVLMQSDRPVAGKEPEFVRQIPAVSGADVIVSMRRQAGRQHGPDSGQQEEGGLRSRQSGALHLVPRIAVLGVGCRKGTEAGHLESCFTRFMEENGLDEASVCAVASIDLKKEEPGLLAFCAARGLPFETYPAEQLRAAEGDFTPSSFVQEITGVDNVCERSAVLAAGTGELLVRKTKFEGVTMALAVKPWQPDWRWR